MAKTSMIVKCNRKQKRICNSEHPRSNVPGKHVSDSVCHRNSRNQKHDYTYHYFVGMHADSEPYRNNRKNSRCKRNNEYVCKRILSQLRNH